MNQDFNNHVNIRYWSNGHLETKSAFHRLSFRLDAGIKLRQELGRLVWEIRSDYLGEKVIRL